jgi:hypothetical protein
MGLELGPSSFMSTIESSYFEEKVVAPVTAIEKSFDLIENRIHGILASITVVIKKNYI